MEKYTVKELYLRLGQALKKLPFQITFHGKVIAVVREPDFVDERTNGEEK